MHVCINTHVDVQYLGGGRFLALLFGRLHVIGQPAVFGSLDPFTDPVENVAPAQHTHRHTHTHTPRVTHAHTSQITQRKTHLKYAASYILLKGNVSKRNL